MFRRKCGERTGDHLHDDVDDDGDCDADKGQQAHLIVFRQRKAERIMTNPDARCRQVCQNFFSLFLDAEKGSQGDHAAEVRKAGIRDTPSVGTRVKS